MTFRSKYFIMLAVLSAMLCIGVDLFYLPRTTVFPDEQRYLNSAIRLLQNGEFWIAGDRAWEMPGTALFFAPLISIAGPQHGILLVRFAQMALLLIQAALTATIAWHIFRSRFVATVTATICCFYPFFIFYQGLLLSETLFNTFLVASFASLYWWRIHGTRPDWRLVLTCLLFAVTAWIKSTLTVLPPVLIAACAWLWIGGGRQTASIFLIACLVYFGALSPWWGRNYVLLHTFVPFTTSATQNLYLGNNAFNTRAGIDWSIDVDPAFAGPALAMPDEVARQRVFTLAAQEWIVNHPTAFLRGMALKFVRFWNIVPNAVEFRSGLFPWISVLSYGLVLLFALVCSLQSRFLSTLFPIYLLIGYLTLIHTITISSLRYRLPLEPFLIVMAALPIATILRRLRRFPNDVN